MILEDVRTFADAWFADLNDHVDIEAILPKLATNHADFEMVFPERTLTSEADFRDWYAGVGENVHEQHHLLEVLAPHPTPEGMAVDVMVVWKATDKASGDPIAVRALQTWLLQEVTGKPAIVRYTVHGFTDLLAQSRAVMPPKETLEKYYHYANTGNWGPWCDLFAENTVMDEQLAGHIEGLSTLREMMKGGLGGYAEFRNEPKQMVISGLEAAVVSYITGKTHAGDVIECGVMNYFRFDPDGKISYLSNFHDSVPFQPLFADSQ